MCKEVMTIVGPLYQATFRCAGPTGFHAFEELVALDNSPIVPIYVTLDKSARVWSEVRHYNNLDSAADVMLEVPFPCSPTPDSHDSPTMLSTYSAPLSEWHCSPFGDRTSASLRRQQCFIVHYCQVALERFGMHLPYEWYKLPWESIVLDFGGRIPAPIDLYPPATTGTPNSDVAVIPADTFNSTNAQKIHFKNVYSEAPNTGDDEGGGSNGKKVVIGSRFLAENSNLSEVQFENCFFGGVSKIEGDFMSNCTRITNVDDVLLTMGGDGCVTEIGKHFMSGCERVSSVDLSVLESIAAIPHCFLMRCKGLRMLELSPLGNVTSIGDYFLHGCEEVQHLDMRPLKHVTSIGNAFLGSCWKLQALSLHTAFTNVTTIGDDFMIFCVGMDRIDLSGFTKVQTIGKHFMRGCRGLRGSLDVSPLGVCGTSIGNGFLKDCIGLTDLDLSPISHALLPQS